MGIKAEKAALVAGFMARIRETPRELVQNRLLNTANRDVGAILSVCCEEDREFIFSLVGATKAVYLKEEIPRMRIVKLDLKMLTHIVEHLAEHLTSDKPLKPATRFFRPVPRED